MKHPRIWDVCHLKNYLARGHAEYRLPEGRFVPARPFRYSSFWRRVEATWLVFTGRADAVTWPGQDR